MSSTLTVRRLRIDCPATGERLIDEPLPALWFDVTVELGERRRTSIPRPHRPVDHEMICRTIVRAVDGCSDRSLEEIADVVAGALLLLSDTIAAVEVAIECDAMLPVAPSPEAIGVVVRRVRADPRRRQSVGISKSPRLGGT